MPISDNSIEYQFLDQYCNNVSFKKGLSNNTIVAYKSDLKIFLLWLDDNKEKYSGCTVHFVNSKLDSGKIILQKKIKVLKNDTARTLQKRILKEEHKIYPKALQMIIN